MDLIKQIVDKTGIPADKAQQVLGVVGGFLKDKFPMIAGQVDSVLGTIDGDAAKSGDGDNNSNPLGDIGDKLGF